MYKKEMLTDFAGSRDKEVGKMETVYVGSRESDRLMRVYIKKDAANNRLVRMEVEYKKPRANKMAQAIATTDNKPSSYLRYDMMKKRDKQLTRMFGRYLGETATTERIRREASVDKTRTWLLKQVLPTLKRYVNGHHGDSDLIDMFLDALIDRDLRPEQVNQLIRTIENRPMIDTSKLEGD
jgi:DNA relaxase NicK